MHRFVTFLLFLIRCRTSIVHFQFTHEPILWWKGSSLGPVGRFISYLKSRKIISKGYLYYLVRVKNSSYETPTLEWVPVISEYPKVFLKDLHGFLPEKELTLELIYFKMHILFLFLITEWLQKNLNKQKTSWNNFWIRVSSKLIFRHVGAPVLFVKLKNSSLRMCIDYI